MRKSILGISTLTLVALYGLLGAIIILVVILLGGQVIWGITASLIVLVIQFLISPWLTDLSMRWFYKAKFGEKIPDYLEEFIKKECELHNVKYPKIAIIHDGAPNAFTYGRTKKDARLVLTEGIFNLLKENEVKAVVAHEIGHIVHYDMLFMTAVQAIPLILYGIYEMLTSSKSDSDNNKAAIIGYIAYILYVLSQYIILYLSRTREYFADAFSVEETKDPDGLSEALVKIGFGLSTSSSGKKASNALGIFDAKTSKSMVVTCMDGDKVSKDKIKNAMKWEMWNPWAKWFELNSTHPLISKRLIEISKRAKEFNQKEYIVFDLKKNESYLDDFALELLINFAPLIALLATFIVFFVLPTQSKLVICIGLLVTLLLSYFKFDRAHKNRDYKNTTVSDLLGEVKVSQITSIPCVLEGTVIGRGNPGCIFNEDFVIKDKTGIIFLDYNQPLNIVNKIFAIFKSKEYFDKTIKVTGWYRRNPVPYVEIKTMEVDGKVKKIWTYPLAKTLYFIGMIALIVVAII